MATFNRALHIATDAHANQKDKGGMPYIAHPLRVAANVPAGDAEIVALLHDVVEDSDWTLDQLFAEGFSEAVLSAVDALTRREGEDYFDFVRRAASDPIGRIVKRADLYDNMDTSRLPGPATDRDRARLSRYMEALAILDAAGGE